MGTYHLTRGQFRQFVKDTGYKTDAEKGDKPGAYGWNPDKKEFGFNAKYSWRNAGFEQTDEHPVVNVSWNDAVAFCKWLSRKEGKTYRLPTEAEWEYACRAGTTTRYYNGDDPETLAKVGNVADATFEAKFRDWKYTIKASDGYVFTAPVGSFQPNAFGLYDMHGNADQWCSDWYGADYYAKSPADDPTGPDTGHYHRVLRGGSWVARPYFARSAARFRSAQTPRSTAQGSALPGLSSNMWFTVFAVCGLALFPFTRRAAACVTALPTPFPTASDRIKRRPPLRRPGLRTAAGRSHRAGGPAFQNEELGTLLAEHEIVWPLSPPAWRGTIAAVSWGNGGRKTRADHFAKRARGWSRESLESARPQANEVPQRQVHPQAVRQALAEPGLLTTTRRSIPLPLKGNKWDKMS